MGTRLEPQKYIGTDVTARGGNADIPAGTLTHSTTLLGGIIDTQGLRQLSFTAEWAAVASTVGSWRVRQTDDPRAGIDKRTGGATATWVERTIPTGSYDGSNISVSGVNITIDANAGKFNLNLTDLAAFTQLIYVSAAGGGADQATVWISGKE